jgi:uncharacterized protein
LGDIVEHSPLNSSPRITAHWAFAAGDQGFIFDKDSLSIFPVSYDTGRILGETLEAVRQLSSPAHYPAELTDILANFHRKKPTNPLAGFEQLTRTRATPPVRYPAHVRRLNKLAINVANDCNLACTYCYANQGLYGNPEKALLGPNDIELFIRRFAEKYDLIQGVQFMGGEPSMNHLALTRAGETFAMLVSAGQLLEVPHYTLVTNGLVFTKGFLDACVTYGIELTISLDGPQVIHDNTRIKKNGSGSYDAVRRNIDLARSLGIVVGFEPTFSRAHLRNGMSLISLVEWFHDEFGITSLHAPPMSENRYAKDGLGLSAEECLREYCAVTEWGIDNLLERKKYLMHSFTERLLISLETAQPNSHLCPAGNSLLSVSTKGDVSPCWMYTDEQPFNMGNVKDADFLGHEMKRVNRVLDQFELKSHPECQACIIQPVCFGCKGGDYHATGTPDGKTNCDFMRAMVVTGIMRILDRPDVAPTASQYYDRPSFGESVYKALRPNVHVPQVKTQVVRFMERRS